MRLREDQLAKDLFDLLLEPHGRTVREMLIPATDAQRADLGFIPRHELPETLGLLARISRGPRLYEFFSDAPDHDALYGCARKLLQWRHSLRKRDPRTEPECGVFCAGRPASALRAMGLAPTRSWPSGVYAGGWGLFVVVLDELPETPDTVLLRVLGRAATRDRALKELQALDAARLDAVIGLLVQCELIDASKEVPPMPVDLSRYYAWKEQQRAEGRAEGRAVGRAEGYLHGTIVGRLHRALSPEERDRLDRRTRRDGVDALTQRVHALSDTDLDRWVQGKRVRAN